MSQEQSFTLHPDLLPELNEHIISFLDDNDIACLIRSVNKAAAEKFKRGTVHLSRPVPPKAYYEHWARPDSTRGLSLKARRKLLCLTAASGVIANLELAIEVAGCLPNSEVFRAAAKSGHLHVCRWLHERHCPNEGALPAAAGAGHLEVCRCLLEMEAPGYDVSGAVKAAAEGGHLHVLEWLLGLADPRQQHAVEEGIPDITMTAARGGHMEVVAWMEVAHPDKPQAWLGFYLLHAAAQGCDLATLQRLHPGRAAGPALLPPSLQQQHEELAADMDVDDKGIVMAAAAGSPTPDWRAKVEWLEGQEYPLTHRVYSSAADRPDWAERLEWLRQQGFPPLDGNSNPEIFDEVAEAAARDGNLAALQSLHASGCEYYYEGAACIAAEHGHMDVVKSLVEARTNEALAAGLVGSAAESGNLQLLEWLWARGEPWEEDSDHLSRAFRSIVNSGNVAAIEWVVRKEKPRRPLSLTRAIERRINVGDLYTLRYLRGLGIVRLWPSNAGSEEVFDDALRSAIRLKPWRWGGTTALRWLLELGCPVDWRRAEAVVRAYGGPDESSLLALLAGWRQRRCLEEGEIEVDKQGLDGERRQGLRGRG